MATAQEVARWMRAQVETHGRLEQQVATVCIRRRFGQEFLYRNRYGQGAIRTEVLTAFRDLCPEGVVWSRRERAWRRRLPDDPSGRRVVA